MTSGDFTSILIDINGKITAIQTDITGMKSNIIELKNDVAELKASVVQLDRRLTQLEINQGYLQHDINWLQHTLYLGFALITFVVTLIPMWRESFTRSNTKRDTEILTTDDIRNIVKSELMKLQGK